MGIGLTRITNPRQREVFARRIYESIFALSLLSMKSSMLFTLGSILFLLNACVGIYPCRKQFSLYKEPFNPSNTKFPIKTNGVYISVNHEGSFYLYNNGYAKILFSNLPEGKSFWKNPSIEIIELQSQEKYFRKEVWGNYIINNDTIIIQTFGLNDQLCKRSVYQRKGVILNDSTIKLYSSYSYWFEREFVTEPNTFRLYETEHKPDSTLAWFSKKRWYKKNLHESRR